MTIPENKTLIEYAIANLEAAKQERVTKGLETAAQGFNLALGIVRSINRVHNITDQGDRLIRAFEEYTHTQKHSQTFRVDNCSYCSGAHGDTLMMLWRGDGVKRYWYICPVLLQPAYHFPENGGD